MVVEEEEVVVEEVVGAGIDGEAGRGGEIRLRRVDSNQYFDWQERSGSVFDVDCKYEREGV